MKIYINDQELSFSLDAEKNLKAVLDALQEHFGKEGQYLTGLAIDGREVNLHEAGGFTLQNIGELRLRLESAENLLLQSLEEFSQYLKRIVSFFQNYDSWREVPDAEKENFLEGLAWIEDTVTLINRSEPRLFTTILYDASGLPEKSLVAQLAYWTKAIQEKKAEELDELLSLLKNLQSNMEIFLHRIFLQKKQNTQKPEELLAILQIFPEDIQRIKQILEPVSHWLQVGKDGDAFSRIRGAMEILEKVLLVIPQISQFMDLSLVLAPEESDYGTTFAECHKSLVSLIRNLADAMENADSVTISDLCEYEIPEVLGIMALMMPDILDRLQSKKLFG